MAKAAGHTIIGRGALNLASGSVWRIYILAMHSSQKQEDITLNVLSAFNWKMCRVNSLDIPRITAVRLRCRTSFECVLHFKRHIAYHINHSKWRHQSDTYYDQILSRLPWNSWWLWTYGGSYRPGATRPLSEVGCRVTEGKWVLEGGIFPLLKLTISKSINGPNSIEGSVDWFRGALYRFLFV